MSGIAEATEAMLTGESELVLKEVQMNCFLKFYRKWSSLFGQASWASNYANKSDDGSRTLKPITHVFYNLAKISSFTVVPSHLACPFKALLIKMLPIKDSLS